MTRTLWIKAPTPGTAVVMVSSGELPDVLAQRLGDALQGWDEVAYLQVTDPSALHQEWLAAQGACQAGTLLDGLAKDCLLLDIENGHRGELAWLGSVRGHALRYLELHADEPQDEELCERILAALGALVQRQLEARFPSC